MRIKGMSSRGHRNSNIFIDRNSNIFLDYLDDSPKFEYFGLNRKMFFEYRILSSDIFVNIPINKYKKIYFLRDSTGEKWTTEVLLTEKSVSKEVKKLILFNINFFTEYNKKENVR